MVTGVNLPDLTELILHVCRRELKCTQQVMSIVRNENRSFIVAAAVADWKAVYKSEKLKKDSNTLSEIKWELNPDIAFNVSTLPQTKDLLQLDLLQKQKR